MPKAKAAARKKPGPKPKAKRRGRPPGSKNLAPRRGRRPGRRPSGRVKRPFSIVLDEHELKALKEIARKKNSSVAQLIRGAMNAVIFQANPALARTSVEKDVEDFLDGMRGKLPMGTRFDGRKKKLKKSLVEGIISGMEKP
jgi:hypothetical protein